MSEIKSVKLELVRPGPAHNQLLSPLTPYLALCGAEGPVTVNLPFEHRQLLSRLERLRYVINGGEVSPAQRQAEVRELGEALGRVLSQVPALLTEVGTARTEQSDLVHLRLSMGAYELALVPFELAIGGDGFPGSGSPLFLQTIAPIALTREVRRGRPLPVDWNRAPRILFAFAAPEQLAVPAQRHLEALRRAIDPWIKWKARDAERIAEVKAHLTVLPNASLQDIRRACAETQYTYVHILAHGEQMGDEGDQQYGLALCRDGDPTQKDTVDGEALAIALTAKDEMGTTRFRPTLVNLATCDSGHAPVMTPAGSIAHALHAGGIPWVIASQFPLWMRASSVAAEVLFAGVLRGDDPRWVLCTLRQRLRTDFTGTHDWASIAAYAVVPSDFDAQVEAFRNRQTRQRIEVKFDEAEKRVEAQQKAEPPAGASDAHAELEALYESIRHDLEDWRQRLPAAAPPRERAERLGMSAASEKRIGNLSTTQRNEEKARSAYARACEFYRSALEADPVNHWVITQYLSMLAVLATDDAVQGLARDYGFLWSMARQLAEWELRTETGEKRAWALATLAELELLGVIYGGPAFDATKTKAELATVCRLMGEAVPVNSFPLFSTRRQFQRYVDTWPRPMWRELAEAALKALQ